MYPHSITSFTLQWHCRYVHYNAITSVASNAFPAAVSNFAFVDALLCAYVVCLCVCMCGICLCVCLVVAVVERSMILCSVDGYAHHVASVFSIADNACCRCGGPTTENACSGE